ncbi:nitrilase-related carbon-nitrogen hydrolase [Deinococcus roseus]|uniref:Apolipoprotein N-acyltransferase n=1 Tax=Deinococcus roseus TaxID=392414 RepID=A0ABQ2D372_9DEIO|nr:nitrilase-related carbon-nitrogen hydrolase [Deinococcus roseus]GGJ44319.1 apolipoprotein N-acyltransferase [Deinococcus roseus]
MARLSERSDVRLLITGMCAGGAVLAYSLPSLFWLGFFALLGFLWLLSRCRTFWWYLLILLVHYAVLTVHSMWGFFLDGTFTPLQSVGVVLLAVLYSAVLAGVLHFTRTLHRNQLVLITSLLYLGELLSELSLSGNYRLPYSLGYLLLDTPLSALYALIGVKASVVAVGFLQQLVQKRHWSAAGVSLAVVATMVTVVNFHLHAPGQKSPVTFTLLQTGLSIPLFQDYTAENAKAQYQALKGLMQETGQSVLLLPETSIPDPVYYRLMQPELQQVLADRTALLGAVYSGPEGVTNAIIKYQGGETQPVYHKRILVPFTETHWLYPGPALPVQNIKGVKLGMAVCMEGVLSEPLREQVQAGAELLFVATNTQARIAYAYQQIGLRARALELRRQIMVASLPGESTWINEKGQVLASAGWHHPQALQLQPHLNQGLTPFARFGQWMALFIVLLGLLMVGFEGYTPSTLSNRAFRKVRE